MKRVGLLSLTALLAVVMVMVAGCGPKQAAAPGASNGGGAISSEGAAVSLGSPDAPVKIVAYYPLNRDHQFIIDYLREFAEARPDEVSLTVWDMQSPEGRAKWAGCGLSCAGVFVNGSTHFEVERDGKTESVDLIKRMDSFWTQEDFEAVVQQALDKAKGGSQGGKDEASGEGAAAEQGEQAEE